MDMVEFTDLCKHVPTKFTGGNLDGTITVDGFECLPIKQAP